MTMILSIVHGLVIIVNKFCVCGSWLKNPDLHCYTAYFATAISLKHSIKVNSDTSTTVLKKSYSHVKSYDSYSAVNRCNVVISQKQNSNN